MDHQILQNLLLSSKVTVDRFEFINRDEPSKETLLVFYNYKGNPYYVGINIDNYHFKKNPEVYIANHIVERIRLNSLSSV